VAQGNDVGGREGTREGGNEGRIGFHAVHLVVYDELVLVLAGKGGRERGRACERKKKWMEIIAEVFEA